jgi:hypothetical protein
VDWICLSLDRDQWHAPTNTIMCFRVHKTRDFRDQLTIISFLRRTLFRGVNYKRAPCSATSSFVIEFSNFEVGDLPVVSLPVEECILIDVNVCVTARRGLASTVVLSVIGVKEVTSGEIDLMLSVCLILTVCTYSQL